MYYLVLNGLELKGYFQWFPKIVDKCVLVIITATI